MLRSLSVVLVPASFPLHSSIMRNLLVNSSRLTTPSPSSSRYANKRSSSDDVFLKPSLSKMTLHESKHPLSSCREIWPSLSTSSLWKMSSKLLRRARTTGVTSSASKEAAFWSRREESSRQLVRIDSQSKQFMSEEALGSKWRHSRKPSTSQWTYVTSSCATMALSFHNSVPPRNAVSPMSTPGERTSPTVPALGSSTATAPFTTMRREPASMSLKT
mmetsp:Transcript_84285/g.247230  ORF Transcript_84285/g.247230 Transcript_84285/m.247230 type:complete len:217 (-) Transcript_84285:212-862(-)